MNLDLRGPVAAGLLILLTACGTPSVGVGVGIPGTPVSVGTSVPVKAPSSGGSKRVVYRELRVESQPDGAEILVNNQLVGSTPDTILVPFDRGAFGGAKGSAQLLVRKAGYLTEGIRVFPVGSDRVGKTESGPAIGTLTFKLRRG